MKYTLPTFNVRTAAVGITIFFSMNSYVMASGFRIPEISIAGLGTANALVANTTEVGALAYNPAAMQFHKDKTLVVGIVNADPENSVVPTGGTTATSQAEDTFLIPNLFYMDHINTDWSWGLALNSPFGLETKWANETFPNFTGTLDPLEPEQSKLEMINLNPNVSFKLNNNSSIAVGLMYYDVRKLVFNTQVIKINGSGSNYGWNLAFQHRSGPWSFGASYKSKVDVDLNGSVSLGSNSSAAKSQLSFPDMVQLGIRYQTNIKLGLEFDIERTGWGTFDIIKVYHSTTGVTSKPITSVNAWENSWAYRLSAVYKATNRLQLRFGYALDKTPQRDEYFSARIPDADRTLYSIGASYEFDKWTLEAGYMYVDFDTRNFTGTKTLGVTTAEANGSNAYNGVYSGKATLMGIGITTHF